MPWKESLLRAPIPLTGAQDPGSLPPSLPCLGPVRGTGWSAVLSPGSDPASARPGPLSHPLLQDPAWPSTHVRSTLATGLLFSHNEQSVTKARPRQAGWPPPFPPEGLWAKGVRRSQGGAGALPGSVESPLAWPAFGRRGGRATLSSPLRYDFVFQGNATVYLLQLISAQGEGPGGLGARDLTV